MNIKVGVILPAAGSGERFGSDTPKQFCHVLHRPIILHTIDSFLRNPWIQNIIIVSSENEQMHKFLSEYSFEDLKKLHITAGSSSRHKSIYSGLQALKKIDKSIEIVIIHDGVRPFVPETVLEQVVIAAKIYGAAGIIRPLVSTVISQDKENFLENVLDRTKYFASEMPQAFAFNMILESYAKCTDHDMEVGTECLQIAKNYGNVRAYLIMSNHDLWKVTYKKDLYATEGIFKEEIPILINADEINTVFLENLKESLSKHFKHIKFNSNKIEDKLMKKTNIIQFHKNKSLMQVVNEELECSSTIKNSIVHIVIYSEFKMDEHYEISKKIKNLATLKKCFNSFIYYICIKNNDITSDDNFVCETITDILFNNSLVLSGQILYM